MEIPKFSVVALLCFIITVVSYISNQNYLTTKKTPFYYGKVMVAEAADRVAADPSRSSAEMLASALAWTRKREKVLSQQINMILFEAAQLRANVSMMERNMHNTRPLPAHSQSPTTVQPPESQSAGAKPDVAGNPEKSLHSKWPNHAKVCTGLNADFKPITATDGAFEDPAWSGPRLDGIEQSHAISEKYVLSYCSNADAVSGFFRVEKLYDCDETAHFSDDQEYSTRIRNHFGPDDFSFSLEGPEVHALTPTMNYMGQCRYELPFTVTVAGKYRLNLIWWRENYNGARENLRGWLPSHYDAPIGHNVYITIGPVDNDQNRDRQRLIQSLQAARNGTGLPDCNLRDPHYRYMAGRWVYIGDDVENIFIAQPAYLHGNAKETIETRGFLASAYIDFSKFLWCPTQCRLTKIFTPAEAQSCMASKKVIFEGDSHLRQLRNALINYVCGVTMDIQAQGCGSNGKCSAPGLDQLCAERDGMGHSETFMLKTDAALNVGNFGQHYPDGERQMKFAQYTAQVDVVARRIAALPADRRGAAVWHETVAQPFRKDSWIKAYGDQRTNTRMKVYNQYATAKMREVGVPVIPAFAQTAAFVVVSADSAHYEYSILQHSSVQYFLGLLCPVL